MPELGTVVDDLDNALRLTIPRYRVTCEHCTCWHPARAQRGLNPMCALG
jgi:hypothetical protein